MAVDFELSWMWLQEYKVNDLPNRRRRLNLAQ